MKSIRGNYSGEFKARVVLEALKEDKTIAEIASKYQVPPAQIRKWRKMAQDSLPLLFEDKNRQYKKTSNDRKEKPRYIHITSV